MDLNKIKIAKYSLIVVGGVLQIGAALLTNKEKEIVFKQLTEKYLEKRAM